MTDLIDIYGHVGLPRFTSAECFLAVMDQHGVSRALLSTAQFCPDLFELARAVSIAPKRFRALGLPLGADRLSIRRSVEAQLGAGFSGIRISAAAALSDPELLEIVGRHQKFAVIVAFESWAPYCDMVADFLDRYPHSFVIGGHFAGPCDPSLLQRDRSMARLFGMDRFVVAFTRQGLFDPAILLPWAHALVQHLGWDRILWGSEWPVALWRDESYADTTRLIDQFNPSDSERVRFFHDNAMRMVFSAGGPAEIKACAELDLMPHKTPSAIHLFPKGFQLPEEVHQKLMHAYSTRSGNGDIRYSEFVQELIKTAL